MTIDISKAKFFGTDYSEALDKKRLSGQLKRVHDLMIDGNKRSTDMIGKIAGCPAASAHRHLSTLRTQYGYVVAKELKSPGLWLYWIAAGGMGWYSNLTEKPKRKSKLVDVVITLLKPNNYNPSLITIEAEQLLRQALIAEIGYAEFNKVIMEQ